MAIMKTSSILDHLEKFMSLKVVAASGSIRKASIELGISQPSLSVKIKTLESITESKLLERTRDGVLLTREGQRTLEFVNDIILKAEELKTDIQEAKGSLKGDVHVGIYDSIARYFWPSFYKYFTNKYPEINVKLSTGRSQVITNNVRDRVMDIGLVAGHIQSDAVDSLKLYEDSFSCFCTPEVANSINTKEYQGKTWLPSEQTKKVQVISFCDALKMNGIYIHDFIPDELEKNVNIHPVENFEVSRIFCNEGLGIALLPNDVVRDEYNSGQLVKVCFSKEQDENFGPHDVHLILNKITKKQPIIDVFSDEITNQVRD